MKRKHCDQDIVSLLLDAHLFIIQNVGNCSMTITMDHHVYISQDGINSSHKKIGHDGGMQVLIKFDSRHSIKVSKYIKRKLKEVTSDSSWQVSIA